MSRILVVEDNAMNRDMLTRRLERRGHETLVAVDGAEAIETARTEQPDIILMDMSLPEIDGWEATRRIKADDTLRSIPVIALTAHAMAGDRQRALDVGCDDYEVKPIDFERLTKKIAALLESYQPWRKPLEPSSQKTARGLLSRLPEIRSQAPRTPKITFQNQWTSHPPRTEVRFPLILPGLSYFL